MRHLFFALLLVVLVLFLSGCASGFRAGGRRVGVEANASMGRPPAPVVIREAPVMPPPPPPVPQ